MALQSLGYSSIVTSDIDDAEVTELIARNFARNGLPCPTHIPHTWGMPWPAETAGRFSTVVASVRVAAAADDGRCSAAVHGLWYGLCPPDCERP